MAEFLATLVPVLGRALLHFVWQGAAIGLIAASVLFLLRDARPQARYAVACVALLACVLLPLANVIALFTNAPDVVVSVTAADTRHATTLGLPTVDIGTWHARLETSLSWIVAMWAAGASVLSLRMTMGVAWIRRLRTGPQSRANAAWQARLDALAQRFGLKRAVALRVVDCLDSPASAGWWRPVVLLPAALIARMPTDLIEALLAHELAHIRRHDYLVNLLQGVVEALLFYHPVVWWLSREIRNEREHIADQLAADMLGAPRRLAVALSELSDLNRSCSVPLHLAQAAHGGQLMSRIEQLVRPSHRAAGGKIAYPLLGLAAACIAFYAHAQVTQRKAPPASPQATVSHVTQLHDNGKRDAYALIRKGQKDFTMSGTTNDMNAIDSARRSIDGDFLWFRRADQAYVVVDPATVARAHAAWRETDKLGSQMEALGDQMEGHGKKLEALGKKMEQLGEHNAETPAMREATRKMEALAEQQQALANQQQRLAKATLTASESQEDKLDRDMDALSAQQEVLSRQMEQQSRVLEAESRRLDASRKPMEALSREMQVASKPMEALSAQMQVLAKQQEKLVVQAERQTRELIREAQGKGLAMPAPGNVRAR
ncbi:M56 family metallopeptidase [Lysobacter sp. CFH 32150]|uniref:M56 family metallopeptidase n=1 Tax=Lysobacter sp. CFH 32150 TaxID=2927128 RepID=UPI001FA6AF6F|nr:M56 family metallopeptidase [Lysobacter sp. CFH 32150]MCI4566612.1 M48 family metalloprotease [Lysobacter sp. CFH 32150]